MQSPLDLEQLLRSGHRGTTLYNVDDTPNLETPFRSVVRHKGSTRFLGWVWDVSGLP